MTLAPGTYPVTIGASGGSPVSGPDSNDGNKGSNSVFSGGSDNAAGGGASVKYSSDCPSMVGGWRFIT